MSFSLVTIIAEYINEEKIMDCDELEVIINHNQIKRIGRDTGFIYEGCLMETINGAYIIQESFECMKAELIYNQDEIIGDAQTSEEWAKL